MKVFKRILSAVITIGFIAAVPLLYSQRQSLNEWWVLRNYTPPVEVAALASETTMTNSAKRLFYVNRPVIADENEFNSVCSKEATIVLGCYIPGKGIYLYNIQDPRLTGVKQVTAAHELLHAAYQNLSTSEKQKIDQLTTQAYSEVTNERIKKTIDKYQQKEPSVVPNELHSIIATEVRNIPAPLEEYYKRYFNNRLAVVDYSDRYEAEFDKRLQATEELKRQIDELKQIITAAKNELTIQDQSLRTGRKEIENLRAAGQIAESNELVTPFNEQVNERNQLVEKIQQYINRHNQLVEQANNLQIEIMDLYKELDSQENNQTIEGF